MTPFDDKLTMINAKRSLSANVHQIKLIKESSRIRLYVDERPIIDWTDDGKVNGKPLGAGKIALRQMLWTQFRYRNFKVWAVK